VDVRIVEIGPDGKSAQQLDLRENDAELITFKPQH
jgi:hypothetical protein